MFNLEAPQQVESAGQDKHNKVKVSHPLLKPLHSHSTFLHASDVTKKKVRSVESSKSREESTTPKNQPKIP